MRVWARSRSAGRLWRWGRDEVGQRIKKVGFYCIH